MDIDLRNYLDPLTKFFRDSTATFVKEHPNDAISTVAIFGDGFHGTAALWADTPENSAAYASEVREPAQDEFGTFCNECESMAFFIGEFRFPEYPNFYRVGSDEPVCFVMLDGVSVRAEEGDEDNHRIICQFLKSVLMSLEPFTNMRRVRPFRIGLDTPHGPFEEFWLGEQP